MTMRSRIGPALGLAARLVISAAFMWKFRERPRCTNRVASGEGRNKLGYI